MTSDQALKFVNAGLFVEVRCAKCDEMIDRVEDRRTAVMRAGSYITHVCKEEAK